MKRNLSQKLACLTHGVQSSTVTVIPEAFEGARPGEHPRPRRNLAVRPRKHAQRRCSRGGLARLDSNPYAKGQKINIDGGNF